MNIKRPFLVLLRLCRPLVHVLLIFACFYGMILLRAHTDLIPGVQLRIPAIDMHETMLFAGIAACLFLAVGASRGLYGLFKPVRNFTRIFMRSRGFWIIASSFVAFMGFGYVFTNGISRFILVMGSVVFLFVSLLIDALLNTLQFMLEKKQPYQVCMIGNDEILCKDIADILSSRGTYSTHIHVGSYIEHIDVPADIVVVVGKMDVPLLQDIADTARIQGQSFYHIGDELFLEDLIAQPQRLGPLMALAYTVSPLEGRRRVIKRLIDIVGSLFGLILLLPLLFIVAVCIKLDSPGPIFYVQNRVGKNKHLFKFIKFRSMFTHLSVGEKYGGEEASALYNKLIHSDKNIRDEVLPKIEGDPRITRVGRFIRATSLDELPSLWSVFIGDMSLVGPRPHMPSEVDRYDRWQERLFSIKPGITGYAQIFGRDTLSFEEEARLDLYYIQNRSLFMDIYVLISTGRVVFSGK